MAHIHQLGDALRGGALQSRYKTARPVCQAIDYVLKGARKPPVRLEKRPRLLVMKVNPHANTNR